MSGLMIVPQGAMEILSLKAPSMVYEAPVFEDAFTVEYEAEENGGLPRSAKQFVKRMQRKEARLRAKGRAK